MMVRSEESSKTFWRTEKHQRDFSKTDAANQKCLTQRMRQSAAELLNGTKRAAYQPQRSLPAHHICNPCEFLLNIGLMAKDAVAFALSIGNLPIDLDLREASLEHAVAQLR